MRALKNSIIVAPAANVLAMVSSTLAAIGLTAAFSRQGAGDGPGDFADGGAGGDYRCKELPVLLLGLGTASSLIVVHAVLGVPLVIITAGDAAGFGNLYPGAGRLPAWGFAVDRVSSGDLATDRAE